MSRSLKKGPFIDPKLEAKVVAQAEGNNKSVIKTWSRASMISPDFVGQTIAVRKESSCGTGNLLSTVPATFSSPQGIRNGLCPPGSAAIL